MRLVVDENIVFGKEAFGRFGEVSLLNGRNITKDDLIDADALIVRSVTNVDNKLLEGTPVKFVGTATIGTDHIDNNYLKKNNIEFAFAPGCNSYAVAEYVITAIFNFLIEKKITSTKGLSIGIIGVGNVGSKVERFARALGMSLLLNDPPLEREGVKKNFVSLEEVLKADIITLHVPLTLGGEDKTYHLFNKNNLKKISDKSLLINTSRGAVINSNDLLNQIIIRGLNAVLDVWENEPNINSELLDKVFIGTPHIAGYSLEGKFNGTKMIFEALNNYLGSDKEWDFILPSIDQKIIKLDDLDSEVSTLYEVVNQVYKIKDDHQSLVKSEGKGIGKRFDLLRKTYIERREFNNYFIKGEITSSLYAKLKGLRFNLLD